VASRKEQKERLRREREERERAAHQAQRRRRLVGYGAGGALVLAAIVAVVVVLVAGGGGKGAGAASDEFPSGGTAPAQQITDLAAACKAAGCELKNVKATSRDHTQSLSDRVKYSTNPPTSGKHFVQPADDGVYSNAPQDEQLVHTLEHGRIIIWVKPSLARTARAALRALYDEDGDKIVLVPRANMPFQVAASAWSADPAPLGTGHLLGSKRYSAKVFDALRAFRDRYRYKGPEPAV
jgi:uncharacterized protein DUF3105